MESNILRKTIATLMTVIMVFSIIPVEAFAADGYTRAGEEAVVEPLGEPASEPLNPVGDSEAPAENPAVEPEAPADPENPEGEAETEAEVPAEAEEVPDDGAVEALDDGTPDGSIDADIKAFADAAFANPQSQIRLSVSRVNGTTGAVIDDSTALAGDTVSYKITYVYMGSPTWGEGIYSRAQTLFDAYENNVITVDLPAGLDLIAAPSPYTYTVSDIGGGAHRYTFNLANIDSGSSQLNFTVTVYIEGNGTENAINNFSMSDNVSFSSSVTVLNKKNNPYTEVEDYDFTVHATTPSINTISPDEWLVEKNVVGTPAVDTAAGTVTVTYKVEIGLNDGSGHVISEQSSYYRLGRDAFAAFDNVAHDAYEILTDTLSARYYSSAAIASGSAGTAITPDSIILKKEGSSGAGESIFSGSGILLSASDASAVAMNTIMVDSDGDGVRDCPVPSYTSYFVTAVYPIDDSYIESFETGGGRIDFANTADFRHQLANKQVQDPADGATTNVLLPVKDAASVQLTKNLNTYTGATAAYTGQYGPITYRLSAGVAFDLYTSNGDGTYTPSGNPSTSHVIEAGTVYYIPANIQYTVTEVLTTAQQASMRLNEAQTTNTVSTPAPGTLWTPVITNNELAADIVVHKVDDRGIAISGATFTLTPVGGGVTRTATSGSDGDAEFTRIPYGTYNLVETGNAPGYSGSFSQQVVIDDTTVAALGDGRTFGYTATNVKNFAVVRLTKYVGTTETIDAMSPAGSDFPGTFVLQRSTDGVNWTDVTEDYFGVAVASTVNSSGQISASVKAFDDSGNPFTYRFVEAIPEGYYNPADESATSATSSVMEVTSDDGGTRKAISGTVDTRMYNRRRVQINVTKQFWGFATSTATAMSKLTGRTVDVSLYRYENGAMTQVGSTQAAGTASWSNLPLYDGDTLIQYYVSEDDIPGFVLDKSRSGAAGTNAITINNKTYLPVTVNATTGIGSVALYNYQQSVAVRIYKRDRHGYAFVPGCAITVRGSDGNIVSTTEGTLLDNVTIGSSSGLIIHLPVGDTYTITETTIAPDYKYWDTTDGSSHYGQNVFTVTSVVKNGTTVLLNRYIYNEKDPELIIKKTDSVSGSVISSGAKFAIYEEVSGVLTAVTDASGNPVVIDATNSVSGVRLEDGKTYYALETVVPEGYIDPNVVPSLYGSSIVSKAFDDGTSKYVVPFTVTGAAAGSSVRNNTYTLTFANIPNTAELTVNKQINGVQPTQINISATQGFPVVITGGEEPVNITIDSTATQTVTLPVYDASGNVITYTITEQAIPSDLSDTYYIIDGEETATLALNGTATVTLNNGTYRSAEIWKASRNQWEFWYTHLQYMTGGTTIGLFEKDGNTWNLVRTLDTAYGSGYAKFTKLERGKDYAFVELACNNPSLFPYSDSDGWLEYPPDGADTVSIPDSAIDDYNVRYLPAETGTASQTIVNLGTLVNMNHFVQFDVTKWIDDELIGQLGSGSLDTDVDTKYDNAVFKLYRYVVPEGQTNLTFDPTVWEDVGTYVSGTVYYEDGTRSPGEFMTDVDQNSAPNVVYMIVEANEGPGAGIILDDWKYTFWQHDGESYTVNNVGSCTPRMKYYEFDDVNKDNILNARSSDPGPAIFISDIRIAKWQDTFDSNGNPSGNFTPLPNVSFGVYLDRECTTLLETLTVGLDATETNNKAWAQGTAYSLLMTSIDAPTGTLTVYGEENVPYTDVTVERLPSGVDYNIYGVRVYIRENRAPEGYTYVSDPVCMYLCFVGYHEGTPSEVHNDAYFVNTATANVPLVEFQGGAVSKYVDWLAPSTTGTGAAISYGSQYRIVDYPMVNPRVSVIKYGYTPDSETIGATAEELDDMDIDRVLLGGVRMRLERLDPDTGRYRGWNFTDGAFTDSAVYFTTRAADGSYTFPHGLPSGDYRITEVSLGNWTSYEMAYTSARPRTFHVGTRSETITMYNPTKVTLTINKVRAGNPSQTWDVCKFTLTPKPSGTAITANTSGGVASFGMIPSGKYVLSEVRVSGGLFSTSYFKTYINSLPNDDMGKLLKALISTNGATLGYTYESVDVTGGKDTVISAISLGTDIELTVENPALCNVSLKKVASGGTSGIQGAVFNIYYKAFSSYTGTTTVSAPPAQWTAVKNGTSTDWTTDANGLISLTNRNPGIYAFVEKTPPAGYDKVYGPNGEEIVYYVVVTGGMNVTATVNGFSASNPTAVYIDQNGEQKNVTVFTVDGTAQAVAPNRPKAGASAIKVIDAGMLDASELEWSVQVKLYDAATGGNLVGTATINQDTPDHTAAFMLNGAPAEISTGATYYVEETCSSDDYLLHEVTVNGQVVSPSGTSARYPVVVTSADTLTVRITNLYMHGTVTFRKVDRDDRAVNLSGAQFKVYSVYTDTSKVEVPDATVTEILNTDGSGTGIYTADIPLLSTEDTNYYIVETSAPENFFLDDNAVLEVTLSAENNVINWGATTDSTKYLVNSRWEATYFNFNTEKLLAIAKTAAPLGIEMLVLDDGWFGHRDDDHSSLGDWYEFASKIGDMADLVRQVHDLGLKFGLWFEPEMISEDSDLYRAHPDWVLHIPGRGRSLGRDQMVLDFSRPEVVDAIAETIVRLLKRAKVDYLKYDMNRNHTEFFSASLPADRQGEVEHRFILGVYRLHRRLLEGVPGLLIEGCSGGGGRFDAGMLRYTPQIWCSDDSDAIERLRIQAGTSLFYPCSAMGAHVSACPNHQVGRTTPFETRATVALEGTFGYELDLTKLSDEDRALVPKQIADFHRFNPLVLNGDQYRLTPAWQDNPVEAWMFVLKDKSRATLSVVRRTGTPNQPDIRLRLQGLDPEARYEVGDAVWSGAALMNAGLPLWLPGQDAASMRFYLKRV